MLRSNTHYASLVSKFQHIIIFTISVLKRCSVRLYPQLLAYGGVFLFCFVCLRSVFCLPNVASFSGLFMFLLPLRCSLTFIYTYYSD